MADRIILELDRETAQQIGACIDIAMRLATAADLTLLPLGVIRMSLENSKAITVSLAATSGVEKRSEIDAMTDLEFADRMEHASEKLLDIAVSIMKQAIAHV